MCLPNYAGAQMLTVMVTKQEMLMRYGGYLDAFIREINPNTTKEEILSQMDIYPVVFGAQTVGVVGLTTQTSKKGNTVVIRLIYIEPTFRGNKLWPVLAQMFEQFAQQGFQYVESWTLPHIANWLETKWGLEPKVKVYHENLQQLRDKIAALRKDLEQKIKNKPESKS